ASGHDSLRGAIQPAFISYSRRMNARLNSTAYGAESSIVVNCFWREITFISSSALWMHSWGGSLESEVVAKRDSVLNWKRSLATTRRQGCIPFGSCTKRLN